MTASPDSYQPPVNRLLKLGDARGQNNYDYLALGLGAEHIADLIRMAQDDSFDNADSDSLEVWAPIHARRALGQLRAEPAIEPLLGLLYRVEEQDDDWINELADVFGQIGPAAMAPLESYAASNQNALHARGIAGEGLVSAVKHYPDARDAVVAALTRLLENFAEPGRDPALNAFLISDLLELDAVEAAPVMERAFTAGVVEEDIVGDWEDVQVQLGLKPERDTPRRRKPSELFETMQLLDQLGNQRSEPIVMSTTAKKPASSKQPKLEIVSPPSGPKRKHHRRKK